MLIVCFSTFLSQYVEKEVKVEDPALKIEVEKLSKENAELKTQVSAILFLPTTKLHIFHIAPSWLCLGRKLSIMYHMIHVI